MDAFSGGRAAHVVQGTPHIAVADPAFYQQTLRPLFAAWAMVWLADKGVTGATPQAQEEYVAGGAAAPAGAREAVERGCSAEGMKLLNLCHEAVASITPHVLSKINRVSYGLLSDKAVGGESTEPVSRRLLAVPFVGKDVPSSASEFSHPDVAIAVTAAAYRHEGLRMGDFRTLLRQNVEMVAAEVGKVSDRPASVRWREWVELAGGRVRGAPAQAPGQGGEGGRQRGRDTRFVPNAFSGAEAGGWGGGRRRRRGQGLIPTF